jgi:hypothetical protein
MGRLCYRFLSQKAGWRGFWRLLAAEALPEVAWYRFSGVYEYRGTMLIESRLAITLLLYY